MDKETLIGILIALVVVVVVMSLVIVRLCEIRAEFRDLVFLLKAGWTYSEDHRGWGHALVVKAPDEDTGRYLGTAVVRQKELDRIKRLNLPGAPKTEPTFVPAELPIEEAPTGELEKWKTD